jgi:hypothetical protein
MTFQPPAPKIGDTVLWSSDGRGFGDPCIGWVISTPGQTTVNVLTFSSGLGFVERFGVHHKDDPGLQENPGWREGGCWAFTDQQATINKVDTVASQLAIYSAKAETRNAKATTN